MKILALVADTIREIYAKKVIIGVIVIELIALVIVALTLFLEGGIPVGSGDEGDPQAPAHEQSQELPGSRDTALLGPDTLALDSARSDSSGASEAFNVPPPSGTDTTIAEGRKERSTKEAIIGRLGAISGGFVAIAGLISLFIMAGIIPSMMERGTIDLLLSKPISRSALVLGRLTGGLLTVAINFILFLTAVWLLFGIRYDVWHLPFIINTTVVAFFSLLVVYSGVLAMSIFTESWILPLIIAYLHTGLISPFLTNREETIYALIESPLLRGILDGLYYALPQTADMLTAAADSIYTGSIDNTGPFIQGAIFIAVMFALALWRFNRKDF